MAAKTKKERDANLDNLKSAVVEWGDKEVIRIEKETKFLRSVLTGRGAEDAAALNLLGANDKLGDEIDNFFLVG
jgi:uridine phosphorylase